MRRLNERQKQAVQYIKHKSRIDNKTYAYEYNVSPATAKRELQDMVNKDILKQTGRGRTTYYTLSDPIMTRLSRKIINRETGKWTYYVMKR